MEETSEPAPCFTDGEAEARKTKGLYHCDRAQCHFLKKKERQALCGAYDESGAL